MGRNKVRIQVTMGDVDVDVQVEDSVARFGEPDDVVVDRLLDDAMVRIRSAYKVHRVSR